MISAKSLITNSQDITENERNSFHYDATQSVHGILQWKVHVLTTVDPLQPGVAYLYPIFFTTETRINEKLVWKGWEWDACLMHYKSNRRAIR